MAKDDEQGEIPTIAEIVQVLDRRTCAQSRLAVSEGDRQHVPSSYTHRA